MNGIAAASPQVVVVGSINRDYVCRVSHLPGRGETLLGGQLTVGPGGKGANQAVAAACLGARTAMIGGVGDDDDGQALVRGLRAADVDVAEVVVHPGARTGAAFVFVAADGENSIVVAPGANDEVDHQWVAPALRRLVNASTVVLAQAEIPLPTLAAVADLVISAGARLVLNLAPFAALPDTTIAGADPLVVNQGEAGALLGQVVRDPGEATAAARSLQSRARSVVITLGPDGAVLAQPDGVTRTPAVTATVVDSTGAGDAFTGVLAAALARGCDLPAAVRWGVAAGTFAVGSVGAQPSYPPPVDVATEDPKSMFGSAGFDGADAASGS